MKILKKMIYDKTVYRCKCERCKVEVDAENDDLHYEGGILLSWTCPKCGESVIENVIGLFKKRVVCYKEVED